MKLIVDENDSGQPAGRVVASSLDEIYCRRRPELDPGQFVAQVISQADLFRRLCVTLDAKSPIQRDWRMLAEEVGFGRQAIEALQRQQSPTAQVLDCICEQQLAKRVAKDDILKLLGDVLVEMERTDAVEILSKIISI